MTAKYFGTVLILLIITSTLISGKEIPPRLLGWGHRQSARHLNTLPAKPFGFFPKKNMMGITILKFYASKMDLEETAFKSAKKYADSINGSVLVVQLFDREPFTA